MNSYRSVNDHSFSGFQNQNHGYTQGPLAVLPRPPNKNNNSFYLTSQLQMEGRPGSSKPIVFNANGIPEDSKQFTSVPKSGNSNPYIYRPEMASNYLGYQGSYNKVAEEKKYIYNGPLAEGSRIPQNRYQDFGQIRNDYRRSQSILRSRGVDDDREIDANSYRMANRQSTDINKFTEAPRNSNSANNVSYNFNQQTYLADYSSASKKEEGAFVSEFMKGQISNSKLNSPQDFHYRSYLEDLKSAPQKTDQLANIKKVLSQDERYGMIEVRSVNSTYQNQVQTNKGNTRKDLLISQNQNKKAFSNIEKDIEQLKNATKQSKQVLERELSRNTYFSRLMEQRLPKSNYYDNEYSRNQLNGKSQNVSIAAKEEEISKKQQKRMPKLTENVAVNTENEKNEDRKDREVVEKQLKLAFIELESDSKQKQNVNQLLREKMAELQRQIESKIKELSDKNKQIWDKSKIIIDKNKTIDHLSSEYREVKQLFQAKSSEWQKKQKEFKEAISQHQSELIQKNNKILQIQETSQELLKYYEKQQKQQNKTIQENKEVIGKLSAEIEQLNGKMNEIAKERNRLIVKNEELREVQSRSDIEQYELKSSLIAQEKQIILLSEEIQELKQNHVVFEVVNSKSMLQIGVETDPVAKQSVIQNVGSGGKKQSLVLLDEQSQVSDFEKKYKQLSCLLTKENCQDHQKIKNKLIDLMQYQKEMQSLKAKQQQRIDQHRLYRMHHDFLEKKCQEMNRELKKANGRLIGANNEVYHGWRLLGESNNEIVLLNLVNLNQKYRLLEQEQ